MRHCKIADCENVGVYITDGATGCFEVRREERRSERQRM